MADWGTGSWGVSDWGGAVTSLGTNAPRIVTRLPAPGSRNIAESAVITVRFFDPDYDLNTATATVSVGGVVAYSGSAGVTSGFVGRAHYDGGALVVQVAPLTGFGAGETVTVYAYIADLGGRTAQDTWTWTVQASDFCYSGLSPLPIEKALQSPMATFLEVEPVRQTLLQHALKTDRALATVNDLNKATRVIYQWAFETELSTVLNPYRLKDTVALSTVVCERQNAAAVDTALTATRQRTEDAIASLYTRGVLPREYITTFMDYVDSTVYSYRVSLAANVLLLARAVELQG